MQYMFLHQVCLQNCGKAEDEAKEGAVQQSIHKQEATWLPAMIHDIQLF